MVKFGVYGEESGLIKTLSSLSEAILFLKQLKEFDSKNGIKDIYYIEKEEE